MRTDEGGEKADDAQLQGSVAGLSCRARPFDSRSVAHPFELEVIRFQVPQVDVLYDDADFEEGWALLRSKLPLRATHAFVTATLPPHVKQALERDFPLMQRVEGPGLHQTRAGVRQKLVDCSAGSKPAPGTRVAPGSAAPAAGRDDGFQLKVTALCDEIEADQTARIPHLLQPFARLIDAVAA